MSVRFVRLYPSDWRSGCIGLSLEQEGLYIRVCSYIYETERRLPLDDKQAAKFMGVHTNAYRKIRDQLAALGKLQHTDEGWTVNRAERELAAATNSQRQKNGQADQEPGRDTRQDTIGDTPHNTPVDTHLVFSEKANDFNGPLKSLTRVDKKERKEEEGRTFVRTRGDVAREPSGRTGAYADLKNWFNGSTEAMLVFIDGCMGLGDNRANSEQWLASTVAAHGSGPVAQAFAMLTEKRAAGQVIARPLPHWSNTAASIKANATRQHGRPQRRTVSDVLRELKEAAQ